MNGQNHASAGASSNLQEQGRSRKGYFISRRAALLMALAYVISLVLTGLLVFYCIPRSDSTELPKPGSLRTRNVVADTLQNKPRASKRLPTHVIPTHYRLQLIPYIKEDNFTTAGEVWITVKCLASANNITLNINDIDIQEGDVQVTSLNPNGQQSDIQVVRHAYNKAAQTYSVVLDQELIPDSQYELYIRFVSQINDLLQGFYRSSYMDPGSKQKRWLASTQFSPTDARRAFPCFDEPAFKARFKVSLAHSKKLTSLSNMPIRRSEPMSEMPDWVWDHYTETLQMSTYLVAFIISDLQPLNSTAQSKLRFTMWSRKSALLQTKYAAEIGPKMLHYLEKLFDKPFPLPKLDLVALPDFGFSGMENWGLITFRESALLYDAKQSTEESKLRLAEVLGHELAHQWFGNLVTPLWWNDLWLKEGFSTFIGYQAVNHVEPTWQINDQFVKRILHIALKLDALLSSHPISVPVEDTDMIRQIFDTVSYAKGASIIRMMSHFLGEETFRKGVTNYLETYEFSNAKQSDLWEQLTMQAHQDGALPTAMSVQQIMDTWTLQTGFPVVTVLRDYQNGSAEIYQEQFLLSHNDSCEDCSTSTWWVPLTFTTQERRDFNTTRPRLWLENKQYTTVDDMPGSNSWVLFNIQETGFYRVNYDDTNWRLLMASYQELPVVTRAQLLDDALNLAMATHLDYKVALDLTAQLISDLDYLPWSVALVSLGHLDNMLAMTPAYGNFKRTMLELLDKVYNNLEFEEKPTDGHLSLLLRAKILHWACSFDHEFCIYNAKSKYLTWMSQQRGERGHDVDSRISPNQKAVVYCTAIKHGGSDVWDFAWKKYLSSNVGADRETLLDALGCTREPWLLNRYLSWITSNTSGIRKQDGARVFISVAHNVVGHPLAFKFLRDNWDVLQSYYGVAFSSISRMVSSLATYMNTPLQLSQLQSLRDDNADNLGTTNQSFQQTIETVQANVRWMDDSYDDVSKWFESYSKYHYL